MNDYIYHHGVKGQRWGVRHDEKSKGSTNKAGKKFNEADSKHRRDIGKAVVISSLATLGTAAVVGTAVKVGPRIKDLIDFGKSFVQAAAEGII